MALGKADENLNIKHAIVKACADAGINNTEVAAVLDYTREHYSRVKAKVQDIQLVTTKRVNKAIRSTEYFTDLKNYQGYVKKTGEVVEPDARIKPSDVLKANEIILDRAFPKQVETQAAGNNFTQINVNLGFLNGLQMEHNESDIEAQVPDYNPLEDSTCLDSKQIVPDEDDNR